MIIGIIPAKESSTRLPGKNMIKLNGKPLIDYSIEAALNSKHINKIYISTDSDKIDNHSKQMGLEVIRRPVSLGGDTPLLDVFRHAINKLSIKNNFTVVGVQADHPDRRVSLDNAIEIFLKEKVDRLMSKQKNGVKNGAHYILSDYYVIKEHSRKDITIIDDCTNIHYEEDLKRASLYLKKEI
ncbi:2-C-methyl-D-erythritol 4-phosphate cytidylyltransferase [Alphaproteobacteria bacterium]|nr:2-C-methyl-D-erythritol 4-phosphate cytidylyltransferase [Alphaproteobacteria bacterium]